MHIPLFNLPTSGFPACRLCPRRFSRRCTPPLSLPTLLPPRPISHSMTASSSGAFKGVASSVRLVTDVYVYSISTRYGSWPAQLKTFWDSTGQLWQSGALSGKFVGAFVSTAGAGGGFTEVGSGFYLTHELLQVVKRVPTLVSCPPSSITA